MRKVKGRNGGTLNVPEKGETNNPNGRPKKLISQLKSDEYSLSQIVDCFKAVLAQNKDDLKEIADNKSGKYTALEQNIASALIKDITYGRLTAMTTVLDRAFGQPTKKVENVQPEQPLFTDVNVSTDNGDK